MTVHASYFTDPACPWSWAMEPALRRLEVEFGGRLSLTAVMGGLAREFGPPDRQMAEWLRAAGTTGMPFDPRLWLEGPPRSSYPAALAVKAAAEQNADAAYLRRLREGFMARRRRLDAADALLEEARSVPGLDVARFRVDLESNAMMERLGADLDTATEAGERAAAAGHELRKPGRVPLPSIELRGEDGEVQGVYGFAGYEELRAAALAAGAQPAGDPRPGVEEAIARYGPLATAEVAALCDLPGPRAPAELWRLATEWRLRPEPALTGELWHAA